ncbi:hypothetical protein [Flavobacterium sp. UBA7682]|uniref:hypothetical protein n=1 Tax=Flavobacterium sp. UBA7682 TaxID=1946560 RepID=UPI0025BF1F86|nr:hypothetical protein [Flavobacterium sp. UBA7682]
MKIVNRTLLILFVFFIVSCKDKSSDSIKRQNTSVVDYQADSVYYKIDVVGDGEKELFLMTNNYVVGDSVIGGISNNDNYTKANKMVTDDPSHYKEGNISILSRIFFYEDKRFNQIASIYSSDVEFHYPILKQGNSFKPIIIDGEKFYGGFLRVQEISDYYLGGRYVNMIYYKNKWRIYSKEIDNPTKGLVPYPKGYCIDSTLVSYNLNKNGFNEIFYLGDGFKCNN